MKLLICFLLPLFFFNHVSGQFINIDSSFNVTNSTGNELSPQWAPGGQKLLFQSDRNGNWDIFIYHLAKDSLEQITKSAANEQNPVWINKGQSIVFDSDTDGSRELYKRNLKSTEVELLLDRPIKSKEPSFSASGKLVYFSGFDPLKKRWEIYSFEFFYQNLNKLTDGTGNKYKPVVSPDEDHVLFINHSRSFPFQQLQMMNWYGNDKTQLTEYQTYDASWDNSGLKIYFISNKDNRTGDIYSMWIDGSHLERLTNSGLEFRYPVISPDGNFMAVCVKKKNEFEIFVIPLEDY
jgi:TolB protein